MPVCMLLGLASTMQCTCYLIDETYLGDFPLATFVPGKADELHLAIRRPAGCQLPFESSAQ